MAHSLPDTNRGGPLPHAATGDGAANASGELAVAAAVSVGAHIYLASSLSLLIDFEASAAASSAEQEGASASSPPQLPPVDATTDDNNDDDVGVVSVSCDFTNVNSINEFYPVQDGKSKTQINVFTQNKLNKLETAEQKDRFCRSWRMCTNMGEHAALMVELVNDLDAQEEARASLAADDNAPIRSPPSLPVPADFTDNKDLKKRLNDHYPALEGKSKKQIPKPVVRLFDSDAARHNFCLKWRKCNTVKEQLALKKKCEDAAASKKKKEKEAKARDQRMKRKREDEEKAERKRKKQEESAAKERERALKRNAHKRQKTAERIAKEQQENIVPIQGLLSDDTGRKHAQASTVASKRTVSKRRSSKEKPEKLSQVTNRHACRHEHQTYNSVMKFGHVTTFENEQKTKDMPLHSQTVITATALASPSKSGGVRKRGLLRDETKMIIASSNGSKGLDPRVQIELYKKGQVNHLVSYMKEIKDSGGDPFSVLTTVPSTPSTVTKLSSADELRDYQTARAQDRARAKTGRSDEDVLEDEDDADRWED